MSDESDLHRADIAHPIVPSSAEAWDMTDATFAPADTASWADHPPHPSETLRLQCPLAQEKLELLDDTVFEAIAGKPGALEQLRALWSQALAEMGAEFVEESRDEYLRHSMNVWGDCIDGDNVRNPQLAVAAMDVISILLNK